MPVTQTPIARCAAISIWARSRKRHRRADAGHHQTARARPAVFHRHGSACLRAETGKHTDRRQLQIEGSSLLGMSEGPDSAPSPNAATAPAEPAPAPDRGRFLPLAKIAVFDIAGPLVAYSLLRSAGLSAVGALVLSGILPVLGSASEWLVIAAWTSSGSSSSSASPWVPVSVWRAAMPGPFCWRVPCPRSSLGGLPGIALDQAAADVPLRRGLHWTGDPKGRDFADRWRYPESATPSGSLRWKVTVTPHQVESDNDATSRRRADAR